MLSPAETSELTESGRARRRRQPGPDPVPVLRRPLEVWVVAAGVGRDRQPGLAGGERGLGATDMRGQGGRDMRGQGDSRDMRGQGDSRAQHRFYFLRFTGQRPGLSSQPDTTLLTQTATDLFSRSCKPLSTQLRQDMTGGRYNHGQLQSGHHFLTLEL